MVSVYAEKSKVPCCKVVWPACMKTSIRYCIDCNMCNNCIHSVWNRRQRAHGIWFLRNSLNNFINENTVSEFSTFPLRGVSHKPILTRNSSPIPESITIQHEDNKQLSSVGMMIFFYFDRDLFDGLSLFLSEEQNLKECQNCACWTSTSSETVGWNEFICQTRSQYFSKINITELIKMFKNATLKYLPWAISQKGHIIRHFGPKQPLDAIFLYWFLHKSRRSFFRQKLWPT